MARTQVRSPQLEDQGVKRADLNTSTTGSAVTSKLVQGAGILLTSTGVDAGTGDVTVAGDFGSITTNFVPKFNGTKFVDSTIKDDTNGVTITSLAPGADGIGFITNAGTSGALSSIGSDGDFIPARVSGAIIALTLSVIGKNLINTTSISAISFIRVAADNSVSCRTPFQTLQDVHSRQTFSDANVTVTAGTTTLAQTGTMSATRVVTFPAASSYTNGSGFWILDEGSGVGPTKRLTCTKTGSDTINGGSTFAMVRGPIFFISDGTSKWTGNGVTVLLTPASATITFQGPSSGTEWVITIPDASWTAARTDTGQTFTGVQIFTPTARTSGSASYITVNMPSDTGISSTSESIGFNFTAGTRTWADGTVVLQRERVFGAPTYNKTTTALVFSTAVINVDIADPVLGTGVTATGGNSYALRAGKTQITGIINIGATTSIFLQPSWNGTGGWIDFSTGGASGIGSGGAGGNAWIGYVSAGGNWFTGSSIGDICYRNSTARLLWGNTTGNPGMVLSSDKLGIGLGVVASVAVNPTARLHVVSTTEQLRIGYDATNYYSTTVGSTGAVVFTAAGVDAGFTFTQPIKTPAIATGSVSCMDISFF